MKSCHFHIFNDTELKCINAGWPQMAYTKIHENLSVGSKVSRDSHRPIQKLYGNLMSKEG
jgi:hypothetical protein